MTKTPRSAYDEVGGMAYFARMLAKIRLFASGELKTEYHHNLGNGADGWCCNFLRVSYAKLRHEVLQGGSDEEILEWCFSQGRRLNKGDLMVWNGFITKIGWRDFASGRLEQVKAENGFAEREDIQTMAEFFEVDEGRTR